jgi:hypothetical protein
VFWTTSRPGGDPCEPSLNRLASLVNSIDPKDSRLNPSCTLTLRQGELEIDLVVWESGEAELAVVAADGSVSQQHFDDLRNPRDLETALSKAVEAMPLMDSKR